MSTRPERKVLFVCSGNTCRSPMAEAIAVDLFLQGRNFDTPFRFSSAGTSASEGEPATREAGVALESLRMARPRHRSRRLTRELIADADAVYAMTNTHLRSLLGIDPSARDKAQLLDPAGNDIPDPIGQSQEVYTQTARRMRDIIAQRLKEHRL